MARLLIFITLLLFDNVFLFAEKPFLLITGCARSGTQYTARVLTEAGLDIGHEAWGRDGISSWMMAVKDQSAPWGPANTGQPFVHIIHQVRHPLKVISSVYATEPKKAWDYILKHIPEIRKEDSHLVKCAKYWYYWNLKAYKLAEWTFQVEEIGNEWQELEDRLAMSLDWTAPDRVPRDVNTRGKHKQFTWEDLRKVLDPVLCEKIQELAKFYGYKE